MMKLSAWHKAQGDTVEWWWDEIKAYKISGLMRHEYTRSPSKSNVTSINKL